MIPSNTPILIADHTSTSNVAASVLTGFQSSMFQATGNVTSHAPPQIADPAGPALASHDHGQNYVLAGPRLKYLLVFVTPSLTLETMEKHAYTLQSLDLKEGEKLKLNGCNRQ